MFVHRMYMSIQVETRMYLYKHVHTGLNNVHTCFKLYIKMYIHVYTCIYMFIDFQNCIYMYIHVYARWVGFQMKTSEVGTQRTRTVGPQRSSVQSSTMALSESISNVNHSFCTPRNIFIWVLVRVVVIMIPSPVPPGVTVCRSLSRSQGGHRGHQLAA